MPELNRTVLAGETIRRDLQYAARGGGCDGSIFQVTHWRAATAESMESSSGYDITDRKRARMLCTRAKRIRNLYEHASPALPYRIERAVPAMQPASAPLRLSETSCAVCISVPSFIPMIGMTT